MNKKIIPKKPLKEKYRRFLVTPLCRIYIIIFLTLFIFWFSWNIANVRSISFVLVFIALLTCEFVMITIESILHSQAAIRFLKRHFRTKAKPKIFEFIFFVSLFIATLGATFAAAGYYVAGKGVEVFYNMFWFAILYGIALACGFYHYIIRLDD